MSSCAACKLPIDPTEKPARDKKGRVFHRACAKRLMEQQQAKRDSAKAQQQAAAVTTAAHHDPIPLEEPEAGVMSALLDDIPTAAPGAQPCPNCGSATPTGNVICMGCGFNFESGRAIKTKTSTVPTGAAAAATEAAGNTAA